MNQNMGGMGGHMGAHAGPMMAWMAVSGLISIALLVLIIVTIIWLLRNMSPAQRHDAAMEELRRRYAAGDVDEDEFRNRRAALREK
jgi:putative membrane protein